MPDTITPEERAAIDAALKRGKAQVVAPGASGETWAWCERSSQIRQVGPAMTHWGRRMARSAAKGNAKSRTQGKRKAAPRGLHASQVANARREEVAKLAADGWSAREIAEEFDVTVNKVHSDAHHLRKAGRDVSFQAAKAKARKSGSGP